MPPHDPWQRRDDAPKRRLFVNDLQTMLSAALHGRGVALLPSSVAKDHETLVRIPTEPTTTENAAWILRHQDNRTSKQGAGGWGRDCRSWQKSSGSVLKPASDISSDTQHQVIWAQSPNSPHWAGTTAPTKTRQATFAPVLIVSSTRAGLRAPGHRNAWPCQKFHRSRGIGKARGRPKGSWPRLRSRTDAIPTERRRDADTSHGQLLVGSPHLRRPELVPARVLNLNQPRGVYHSCACLRTRRGTLLPHGLGPFNRRPRLRGANRHPRQDTAP